MKCLTTSLNVLHISSFWPSETEIKILFWKQELKIRYVFSHHITHTYTHKHTNALYLDLQPAVDPDAAPTSTSEMSWFAKFLHARTWSLLPPLFVVKFALTLSLPLSEQTSSSMPSSSLKISTSNLSKVDATSCLKGCKPVKNVRGLHKAYKNNPNSSLKLTLYSSAFLDIFKSKNYFYNMKVLIWLQIPYLGLTQRLVRRRS